MCATVVRLCLINSIPSVKCDEPLKYIKLKLKEHKSELSEPKSLAGRFYEVPSIFLRLLNNTFPSLLYGPPQLRDKGPEPCVCGGILLAGTWCLAYPLALARGPRCDLLTPHLTRARPVQSPQLTETRG